MYPNEPHSGATHIIQGGWYPNTLSGHFTCIGPPLGLDYSHFVSCVDGQVFADVGILHMLVIIRIQSSDKILPHS